MTRSDDSTPDMADRITSAAAERLLTGAAQPEPDASEYEVARLLTALRTTMPSDGVREQEAVASFAAAVSAAPARLEDRRAPVHRRRTVTIAAAAAAFVLLGGTAAAATTGSLPDGAQSAVSKVLSHVSVDVPDPEASQAPAGGDADAVGPDATGAAHRGLCTAWAARGRNDADRGRSGDSTAFSNLRRAAHHDGLLVEDFCADVLDGGTTADDPSVAPASDPGTEPGGSGAGHGQSDADHGAAGDPPAPVDVPNGGGVGTGTDASQGANDGGASHAADAATRGSANRDGHRNAPSTTTTPTGSAHSGR